MANSGFLITDAGLAAATIANPGGPYIHITRFELGGGYNYTPSRLQQDIQGVVLYNGIPNNYTIVDANTIEVDLLVGPDIGSFDFGEVALFLESGALFAICVFDTLQQKLKGIGPQAGNSYRFRSRLRLAQAPAICNVTIQNGMKILEVPNWQSLFAPVNQPSGANAAIIHDPNPSGQSVIVVRGSDFDWSLPTYALIFNSIIGSTGGSATPSTVTDDKFLDYSFDTPVTTSRYLIKFINGDIRKIIDVTGNVATLSVGIGFSPTGAFSVFESLDTYAGGNTAWATKADYNALANDFNPYWSTATGVYPNNKGWNQTMIPILTRNPRLADWNVLTGAVSKFGQVVGVDTTQLVNTDYIAHTGPNATGLGALSVAYSALIAAETADKANKDNVVEAALDFQTPAAAQYTYSGPWNAEYLILYDTAYYSGDSTAPKALFNSGHSFRVTTSVSNGVSSAWAGLKALIASVGTITVGRHTTTSSTNHPGGSQLGYYNLTGTETTIFSTSLDVVGGQVTYGLNAYLISANVLRLVVFARRNFGGGADSSTTDSWNIGVQVTRPRSNIINTPVLAFPTFTQYFATTPEVVAAPAPPAPAVTLTLYGPPSGLINQPSSPFTVGVTGGSFSGTINLSSTNGATLTPSTLSGSGTFTVTPIAAGLHTISLTNTGGAINPPSVTYAVGVPAPPPPPPPPNPTPPPPPSTSGNANYDTPGTYTFSVPAGITTIYTGSQGGGAGGGGAGCGTGGESSGAGSGGGSGFYNNPGAIAVTPGENLTVVVGSGGFKGGRHYSRDPIGSGIGGPGGPSGIQRGGTFLVYVDGGSPGQGGHEGVPVAGGYGFQTGGYGNPTFNQFGAKVPGGNGGLSAYGTGGVGSDYSVDGFDGIYGGGGGGAGVSENNPQDAGQSGGRGGDGFVHISWGNATQPPPNVPAPGYPAAPGIDLGSGATAPGALLASGNPALLFTNSIPQSVSCIATGGTAPYTYTWHGTYVFDAPNSVTTNVLASTAGVVYCTVRDSAVPQNVTEMTGIPVTDLPPPSGGGA